MSDQNQTEFRREGDKAFPLENKENDNSSESSTVKDSSESKETNADQTGSPDQNKTGAENKSGGEIDWSKYPNIADHPRWKERDEDWKKRFNDQEDRHVNEINKLREEFVVKKGETGSPEKMPSWFGGTDEQWEEFVAYNNGLINRAKEEARTETLKELESKSASNQKAIDEATTYFNDQVKAIENDKTINPQGLEVDRNKLLKTALDNDLVDSKGRWNYRVAFKMMKPQDIFHAKEALKDRKNLADTTTSERGADSKPSSFMTTKDFSKPENRPW